MTTDKPLLFSRRYRTDHMAGGELTGRIEANAEEREAMARVLELEGLDRLSLEFGVAPIGQGRYRVRGRLRADVTQTCVVTLESVRAEIDQDLALELWPEQDLLQPSEKERQLLQDPDLEEPEAIRDGEIDLGIVAYECLASSLDPYPRRAGVAFEWKEEQDREAAKDDSHPFDALRALKRD